MPDTPTPGVNGQVLSAPALQPSMSMLSFAPAATMFGWAASMATAGSFCLFCENGVVGLPTVTSMSPPGWAFAVEPTANGARARTPATERRPRILVRRCVRIALLSVVVDLRAVRLTVPTLGSPVPDYAPAGHGGQDRRRRSDDVLPGWLVLVEQPCRRRRLAPRRSPPLADRAGWSTRPT